MEINVYTFMVDSIVNFFYIYNVFFDTLSLHFSVFHFSGVFHVTITANLKPKFDVCHENVTVIVTYEHLLTVKACCFS